LLTYTVSQAGKNSHAKFPTVKDLSTRFIALVALCACAWFIAVGLAMIPHAGIQNDEALFSGPLYLPISKELRLRMFYHDFPLMLMSYLGTLKTLIYWPIFAIFRPNAYSVRLPTVLAGALTIWILCQLTLRIAGVRAALIATCLLATDPVFLLTDTFDWGPVALEHLLLVTACFFLVRFAQTAGPATAKQRDLVMGFLALGLALWNKAIFVWALAGIAVAAAAVCWPEIRRALTPRTIAVAMAAFLTGALPFVIYNLHQQNATFGTNAHLETPANLNKKVTQLRIALDGSALFWFIASDDFSHPKAMPFPGRMSDWVHSRLGEHRQNGMIYALALLALAVPLWWPVRAARFALVFMTVTWLAMAFTRDAGTGTHHAVLIWPFPQIFIATTLGSLRWKPLAISAAAVLVGMNLLVVNQYVLQLDRNGADGNFTDALPALSDVLHSTPGTTIYSTDWGIFYSLTLLNQGHLKLDAGDWPFMNDTPAEMDRQMRAKLFSEPDALFVGHVKEREAYIGVRERIEKAAQAAGYRKDLVRIVNDSNGRPVFEIFRFEKI
jgi:4-amino-4-deoxy-L-arabinose transferase-like glycosyltransferase